MRNYNEPVNNRGRVLAGAFIIGIGVLFFIRQAGVNIIPYWVFTWPMILIAIGVFSGLKHDFRGGGWLVMVLIGAFFLLDDILDMYELRRYIVPVILVAIGAMLILRPKRDRSSMFNKDKWQSWKEDTGSSFSPTAPNDSRSGFQQEFSGTADAGTSFDTTERLDATAIFGSVKKNIMSKNFTGGEATSIFGGSEIDLSKADIKGTIIIDVTAILGGVKLIVPPHWTVRQEVTAIFGGVEDKRNYSSVITVPDKILVLQGTAFMGGIEIAGYR